MSMSSKPFMPSLFYCDPTEIDSRWFWRSSVSVLSWIMKSLLSLTGDSKRETPADELLESDNPSMVLGDK